MILPIVLAVGVSVGYTLRQPRTYQAGVSLWCDTQVPNQSSIFSASGVPPSASQSAVLTELLQTRIFLIRVGQAGPWAAYLASHSEADNEKLVYQLGRGLSVTTPGPHVLAIAATGASSQEALSLVSATASAYIAQVDQTQADRAKSSVGFYQVEVDAEAKALQDAKDQLNAYVATQAGATGPAGVLADATLQQLTRAVATAQANYDSAKGSSANASLGLFNVSDSGVLRVFDPPTAASKAVSRKKKLVISGVAGLAVGALVSFVMLMFMVVGDRSVSDVREIEQTLGLQVVGTIEQFRTRRRRGKAS